MKMYRGKLTIYEQMKAQISEFSNNECWEPLSYVEKNGYWKVSINNKNYWAHRIAFELYYGELPARPGIMLDHLCRNSSCWNPRHLELVTASENVHRGNAMLLHTYCKRGHELNSENVNVARTTGARNCRQCSKIRMEKFLAKNR